MLQLSKLGQKAERTIKNHTKYPLENITKKFCNEEVKCIGQTIIKEKTPFQFVPERIDILTINSLEGKPLAKVTKSNKKPTNFEISNAENKYFNKNYDEIQNKIKQGKITAEDMFNDVFDQIKTIAQEAFTKF